ncbi:GNAT family N-acetyltransferase [Vibrio sp. S4M6]|uniref:GNAT family N-acetyltransferase n=1 Tax=Vibrio sinus TaxID=2946865 RepID=UPI00202A529F|nr:GNAT family N-acetyltransferase [Vibrio sinus]MCL9783420.1 GNAT family N-acetyltransferase [Vibrio sinus]
MKIEYKNITAEYDQDIRQIIQKVGEEFGAVGEGFGPGDPEVLEMSQHYTDDKDSLYILVLRDGVVVGGCGIAPFNSKQKICELKKLFLLPDARGLGAGKALTLRCLEYATSKGYKQCYLDTLSNMEGAIAMYESLGFTHLEKPIEGTIHNKCDVWMIKDI